VPQTVGPEPQGTGVVHPLLRMAGHTGQREANRQLTSVLPATTALAKMTIIVPVEPKNLNTFLYEIKSGTLVAIGYCVAFTFTDFLWTSVHPIASCSVTAWARGTTQVLL